MLQPLALLLGGLASALVLASALILGGPPSPAAAPVSAPGNQPGATASGPQVQVDTVYLAPPAAPRTIIVHHSVPAGGGEGEHEGPDGD